MPDLDLRHIRDMGKASAPGLANLVGREITLDVIYRDPDGAEHRAGLLSRILSRDERLEVSRICARMAGVQWSHLPPMDQARIVALATVAVQVREPPPWFNQWCAVDDDLLFTVVGQCNAHDARYLRGGPGEGDGDPGQPRVAVHSPLSAEPTRVANVAPPAGSGAG